MSTADVGSTGHRGAGQPTQARNGTSARHLLTRLPQPTQPRPWGRMEAVLPPLSSSATRELEGSIAAHGVRVPVLVLPDGRIIDGHNRWRLSGGEAPVDVADLEEDDAFVLGLALNLHRRHLTPDQLQDVHERLRKERGARRELALQLREQGSTQDSVAAMVGVARQTVASWERGREAQGEEGQAPTSIASSGTACTRPDPAVRTPRYDARVKVTGSQRAEIVERVGAGESQVQVAADYGVTQQRVAQVLRQEAQVAAQHVEVLSRAFDGGRYPVVLADPPWRYHSAVTQTRAVENHYPTLDLAAIKALGASADFPAADDAVLFLWATSPKLAEALEVVHAWGFEYVTCATWVKDRIGQGYYFRQRHELLLVGRRGSPAVPEPSVRPDSVIEAPRGGHSAKPPVVHDLIEAMYPDLPRVELFARGDREGWSSWGHRVREESA